MEIELGLEVVLEGMPRFDVGKLHPGPKARTAWCVSLDCCGAVVAHLRERRNSTEFPAGMLEDFWLDCRC